MLGPERGIRRVETLAPKRAAIGIRTRVMVTITSSRVLTESCATRLGRKMGATRTRWQIGHAKHCYCAIESDVAPRAERIGALGGERVGGAKAAVRISLAECSG
jgi:hypothetical protein